jgi:crotonobetainyl-CoA:carnitine CoA-transferase CaiB-like acyl-CoA transferase
LKGTSTAAAYYYVGKRSITLNLREPDGRAIFRKLVSQADVVVDGGPPARAKRWGIDYATLNAVNSRVVVAAITPYGLNGPKSGYHSSALVSFASGGLMAISGPHDGPPVCAPGNQAMIVAGAHAAFGILTALSARTREGHGQLIDVSIQAVFAAQENVISTYTGEGRCIPRVGSQHRVATPGRIYACQDGWVHLFVSPAQKGAWERLMEWMGYPDALRGSEWSDPRYRRAHAHVIDHIVAQWIRSFKKQDLYEQAQARKIPCAPVNSLRDFLNDEQTRARGFRQQTADHDGRSYEYLASPWTINLNRVRLPGVPPVGADNENIYGGLLSLSSLECEQLHALGVI